MIIAYLIIKQENHVVKGQCVPIKQELEENASSIFVKQEYICCLT